VSLWRVEGSATIKAQPRFIEAFVRRIESGLLSGSPARNRYRVTHQSANELSFRADGWVTAIAMGFNDVQLTADPSGAVRYSIEYPRWSAYVLALGTAFGVAFIVITVRLAVPRLAWAIALFWAFAWPWILIALYRGPLRRTMERVIAEVDAK